MPCPLSHSPAPVEPDIVTEESPPTLPTKDNALRNEAETDHAVTTKMSTSDTNQGANQSLQKWAVNDEDHAEMVEIARKESSPGLV